jgi:hypothetical protein
MDHVIEWTLFAAVPGGIIMFQNGVLPFSEANAMLYMIVWTFAYFAWRDWSPRMKDS